MQVKMLQRAAMPVVWLALIWSMSGAAVAVGALIASIDVGGSSNDGSERIPGGAGRIERLFAGIPQKGDSLGKDEAAVTLEFFGDLQCPDTRAFMLGALPFIVRRWVRAGDLRLEFRSLRHDTFVATEFVNQQAAAVAAGRQGKLWQFIDFFFYEQKFENSRYVTERYLHRLARRVKGLNVAEWREDRRDPGLVERVMADDRVAARMQHFGSPSFLIGRTGGRMREIPRFSLLDSREFDLAIEGLLKEEAA